MKSKVSSAPNPKAAILETTASENGAKPSASKSNDVMLAIKVLVIAAAVFGAIWMLDKYVAQ